MNRNSDARAAELLRLIGQVDPPGGDALEAARAVLLAAIAALLPGPRGEPERAAGRAPELSPQAARRRPVPPDPALRRRQAGD